MNREEMRTVLRSDFRVLSEEEYSPTVWLNLDLPPDHVIAIEFAREYIGVSVMDAESAPYGGSDRVFVEAADALEFIQTTAARLRERGQRSGDGR